MVRVMTDYYDFETTQELHKNISYYTQRFILYPEKIMGLTLPVDLRWQSIQFISDDKSAVSEQQGVYAFVIRHEDSNLPVHGYIAYFGITTRTLRDRYGEYLQDQKRPKRPPIHELLNKWKNCIYFCFAEVMDINIDLHTIEKQLNGSMLPPYSTQDFDADIRQAKGIWEKT